MVSKLGHVRGHVLQAAVVFDSGADTRAPGGAVTVALCGSWEHEGTCRWPHQTAVDASATPATVRVVYMVDDGELDEVRDMIESALTSGDDWSAVAVREDELTTEESALAERLRGEDQ